MFYYTFVLQAYGEPLLSSCKNIKSEIDNLIHNRNRHLYNAIDNALDLAMSEKGENFYPTAYLAVSSINSFLRMLNNSDMNFMLPISVMMK